MNKYIKKICSGIIISVMAGSLTGCGSSTQTGAKKTSDGKIQVEYWYGLGGKLDENMQKIINDFNESQDKYEVKGVAQEDYDATYKSLQAAIAAKKKTSPLHMWIRKILKSQLKKPVTGSTERTMQRSPASPLLSAALILNRLSKLGESPIKRPCC